MAVERGSDDDLLAAAPDDPEAFGVFYRRHAEAVLGYLLYRTRSPEQALDLTAETFAAVALPPEPADGRGLALDVRLRDGRLLRTEAP